MASRIRALHSAVYRQASRLGHPEFHRGLAIVKKVDAAFKLKVLSNLGLQKKIQTDRFLSTARENGYHKEVDEINSKFAEAREEIELAMESKETVYFDDEAENARIIVQDVLDKYEGLLARLPDAEKGAVQRSMGLKMEQLKAELAQLKD